MQSGETLSYQGHQVCLFPMDYIYVTQTSGPSSSSHCCGHPTDYIGTYNYYPIYAPCDCHLVYSDSVGNTRAYTSDDQVWTPQGLQYVTFSFTHDEIPPGYTSFSQGELIAHTGRAGQVTGDHTHIDQSDIADAQLVYYGITCAYGNPCYALEGSQPPEDIFYLSGNEIVAQTLGIDFETWSQPPEPPTPSDKAKYAILLLAGKRKRRDQNGRIKRYSDLI